MLKFYRMKNIKLQNYKKMYFDGKCLLPELFPLNLVGYFPFAANFIGEPEHSHFNDVK